MSKKMILVLVSMLIVFSMILTACGTPAATEAPATEAPKPAEATEAPKPAEATEAPKPVEIAPVTLWTKFNDANPQNTQDQWLAAALASFKTDTNIEITNVFVPYDQINSKVNLAVQAGGDVPDVSYVDVSTNLGFFIENGTLTDITDYVKAAPWYADLNPAALNGCTDAEGRIYCVPSIISGRLSYYWTSAYPDGAPVDTDAMLAAAEGLKAKNLYAMTFKGAESAGMTQIYGMLIKSFGGTIADESGKVAWASPETVKAVEFARTLFANKYAPDVALGPGFDNETPFKDGTAGYFCAGSWSYVYLNPLKSPDGQVFDNGAASVDEAIKAGALKLAPPLAAPGSKPVSLVDVSAWGIPTGAQNVDGAKAFIDYMMGAQQNADYAFAYGALPVINKSMEDPRFAESAYWQETLKIFTEYGEGYGYLSNPEASTKMAETIVTLIQKPDLDILTELQKTQDDLNAR